jgi:ferredoxin
LKHLEDDRKYQVIPVVGFPVDHAMVATSRRKQKMKSKKKES